MAAGEFHTCTAHLDGAVECWGFNAPGQLGNGSLFTVSSATPILTQTIRDAASVGAGYDHSCAVLTSGQLWCWGNNEHGQLGADLAATPYSYTPIQVPGVEGAIAVAGGYAHTCALIRNGTAACWGANEMGQLGDGTQTGSPVPVRVAY